MSTLHISPFPEKYGSLAEYYNVHRAMLSPMDRVFATMADKEGDGLKTQSELGINPAYAKVSLGGSLVTIKRAAPRFESGDGPLLGGLRGEVTGFSSDSRRRLMRVVASTERENSPLFVTMTYPDLFDQDSATWKRDIDTFGKRFIRSFPDGSFVWRLEFKERKSGENVGLIAPHFHLLVWGVDHYPLRKFVKTAWWGAVGSGDADNLAAGTRTEHLHSFRGVMRYVSKYISKLQQFPIEWTGRVWGIINRKKLPRGIEFVIPLSDRIANIATRLGRKMIKMEGKTLVYGLTWIMNAERLLDYLEWAESFT